MEQDPDVRWIVITPRYPSDVDTVRSYLYSHSVVIGSVNEGYGDVVLVVLTGRAGRGDADDLAQYQAQRLHSGLIPAVVCPNYAAAWQAMVEVQTQIRDRASS